MKIDIRMEDNKPIIFLIDDEGYIVGFNKKEGHVSVSRAYMRSLKKPDNRNHILECWRLLSQWANIGIDALK